MITYNINKEAAPKEWAKFKKWHKLCCVRDPLTAEERFKKIGGKMPKKKAEKTGE
jgi:hypothetical protein